MKVGLRKAEHDRTSLFSLGLGLVCGNLRLLNFSKEISRQEWVSWCIPVHPSYYHCRNFSFCLLGGWASMHPHEADWTKTGGCYGKSQLKGILHAPPWFNSGQHMCFCAIVYSTWLWETHGLLTINQLGCLLVHCNLREKHPHYSYFYWIQGIFSPLLWYDFRT